MPRVTNATRGAWVALCLGAAAAGVACAAAPADRRPAPPADAKAKADHPKAPEKPAYFDDLAEAERQDPARLEAVLGDAEVVIGSLGQGGQGAQPALGGATPQQPQQTGAREDGCTTACKALASMKRASERLCSLTGEGDARCTRARERTKSATAKVKESCPSCS